MSSWSRTQLQSFAAQGAAQRRETVGDPFTHAGTPYCGTFSAVRRGQELASPEPGGFSTTAASILRIDTKFYPAFAPAIGDLIIRTQPAATLRIANIARSDVNPELVLTLADVTA